MSDTWWNLVRAELARGGVLLDEDGRYSREPQYAGEDAPPPAGLLQALNEAAPYRAIHPRQQLNWVRDFAKTIDNLVGGKSTHPEALSAVFWLRLHGILVDINQSLAPLRIVYHGRTPSPGSIGAAAFPVVQAIDALQAVLREDELLWAEYRRHTEAHVWQGSYEPQWNKRQLRQKDCFTSKLTGRKYEVHDLDRRLQGVLARYESERHIADDFAQRLRDAAHQLLAVTERFCRKQGGS